MKHIDSNQQMINCHVPICPVYVGLYHQFDSISSTPNHVGSTQRTSFQGVSYQADASRSLDVSTKGTNVHTDYSSHPIQSQADGGRSSCFSSLMTHVDYPFQSNGTMIATLSINAVCSTIPLSQEQVSMDYPDSHVSSSPVHANVSATASYIYTNDHLQFDSQSTSVQSESLHSYEHASIHEEKCNHECKKSCSESNSSTTNISSNNADNSLHASSSKHSTSTNRMYEFTQPMKIATANGLQLATRRPKENLYRCLMNFRKNSMKSSKKCMRT